MNKECREVVYNGENMVKPNNVVVMVRDTRNFKTYHTRKLTDRDKLDEIYNKMTTMYGNELDDYDKVYIEMLSSGVTVYDIIDEI